MSHTAKFHHEMQTIIFIISSRHNAVPSEKWLFLAINTMRSLVCSKNEYIQEWKSMFLTGLLPSDYLTGWGMITGGIHPSESQL